MIAHQSVPDDSPRILEPLRDRFGITDAAITSIAAPLQIEGTLPDGRIFYFRARHGEAELSVAAADGDPIGEPDRTETCECNEGMSILLAEEAVDVFWVLLHRHLI